MQALSPKPSMEERKLWRSRSLPANSITSSPSMMTRASSFKATRQSSSTSKGLFSATKATRPSALLERRKKVNPALKVEAFNNNSNNNREPSPSPISKPRSPYEILQVSPLASQEDIKTAYWRSALKHHPDKVPSQHRDAATLRFLEIKSAYSTLKDPIARARFDLQMSLQSFQSSGYHYPSPASSPSSHPCTPPSPYRYTPRAHSTPSYTPFSSNLSTPRANAAPSSSPNYYTPRSPYSNYYAPRSPYSIGRNWETDQCV